MVGFEQKKAELEALGARMVAASVDPIDKAREVAADLTFPVAYGVTREQAEQFGSWWEDRRSILQPSAFVFGANGKVLTASYSSGPIGRIEAVDAVRWLTFVEAQQKK